MAQRKTNVQLVKQLMEHSKSGALMQAFVIEAISKYADLCIEQVKERGPESFSTGLLHGPSWVSTAVEAQAWVKENYR